MLLRLRGWPTPANPGVESLTVLNTDTDRYTTAGLAHELVDDPTAVECAYERLETELQGRAARGTPATSVGAW